MKWEDGPKELKTYSVYWTKIGIAAGPVLAFVAALLVGLYASRHDMQFGYTGFGRGITDITILFYGLVAVVGAVVFGLLGAAVDWLRDRSRARWEEQNSHFMGRR